MKRLLNMLEKIQKISKNNGEIYIRCAGKFGQYVLRNIEEFGIHVTAFLDMGYKTAPEVLGVPVLSPDAVCGKNRDSFFVLVAIENDDRFYSIYDELTGYGLRPYDDFCDFAFLVGLQKRMRDYQTIPANYDFYEGNKALAIGRYNEMREVVPDFSKSVFNSYNLIGNLDLPLTTYCSLRCEHCSHCMPFANPPKHFDAQQVIDDLERVLSVSYIACVAIMGGEPFIYPDLTSFLDKYRLLKHFDNIGFTRVITNGTVLPDDAFFKAFKKVENSYVHFSNYGEKSKKLPDLIEKCKEFQIPYFVCPDFNEWLVLGDFDYKRDYTEEQLKHLFAVCDAHYCAQLINGRLYSCSRTPLLNEDGLIPFSNTDYCEIRRSPKDGLAERLHEYLYSTPYLCGCNYCDGQHLYSRRIKRGN